LTRSANFLASSFVAPDFASPSIPTESASAREPLAADGGVGVLLEDCARAS
jgi:hypothetical protein